MKKLFMNNSQGRKKIDSFSAETKKIVEAIAKQENKALNQKYELSM